MMSEIKYSKASACARDVLEDNGFDNLLDFSLELFASGLGATVIYKPLINSDGRIIFGKKNTIIEVNSDIEFEQKKRQTLAHELGHFVMHKNIDVHNDNDATMSWFNNKEKQAKHGKIECEANQFASELLMPSKLFIEKQKDRTFSPDLLRELADYFKTSLTSIAFKYLELGNHPICLFHSFNGKVSYWKRHVDFPYFIVDRTKLPVPEDSVAMEFYKKNKIYSKEQSKQSIWKSTWFELKDWEDDNDFNIYEYAIVTSSYNTVLSVVWEE
ncbi:ImmA/IrrE family metallo-endopeptidase [Aquimarina algiphila]|uniref:ImmA/IrrE family metallo-endopeptidase n=1 Tax=Aquimarina algiphila TaxID=2047982 RepID=UPI002492B9A8|nr:ImmA/IrrE family metallo-endopeptidase [Aquimarina algiphila]